ncbi:hypothetical protein PO909_015388, partial [Leuciscus waleckii]
EPSVEHDIAHKHYEESVYAILSRRATAHRCVDNGVHATLSLIAWWITRASPLLTTWGGSTTEVEGKQSDKGKRDVVIAITLSVILERYIMSHLMAHAPNMNSSVTLSRKRQFKLDYSDVPHEVRMEQCLGLFAVAPKSNAHFILSGGHIAEQGDLKAL